MFPLEGPPTGPLGPLLPEHLSEFVVGIILFFIIVLAAWKIVVPRFEKIYAERSDAISGELDRADQAQAAARAALAEYKNRLSTAEDEAAAIREAAKVTGAQIHAELAAKAEAEADRIIATARVQVDAEKAQAMESLRKDVGTMATVLAGKILEESLDDDARAMRTVDTFIASLNQA
ncbi:MAG: F0F1 ATP synthase subunit B [Propionibacteriaceae bacterium]|jgi:F-type H+-transporting ATPase subunit b|nr:F0F1 ATP synthase subunit B [Propionibacteriaceae bacterium]